MRNILIIFRREMASYFATPLAYIFIIIFLVMAGVLTIFIGNFVGQGQADLQSFFGLHPWFYLFLIPALSMRLWACLLYTSPSPRDAHESRMPSSA